MADHLQSKLLVTGASGHLGRLVVELLLQAGATQVIATTRTPEKLADLKGRVDVRKADFEDAASLDGAFRGAERALLISTDALHQPGLRLSQHRAAIAASERAGVKHVLYTSVVSPAPKAEGGLINDHFWTELAVFASKMDWTILRHNIYSDMILMRMPQMAAAGQFQTATKGGARSYVTREDCARADVGALLTLSGKQVLEVSGPAAVTQDEVATLVGEAAGKPVRHVNVNPAELEKSYVANGIPAFRATAMTDFDVAASQGFQAHVTDAVKRLTGKEPASLQEFLAKHRAAAS